MSLKVKLLLPGNLNSTYLQGNFIQNDNPFFVAAINSNPNTTENLSQLVFGFQVVDPATRLQVNLVRIQKIMLSNDPAFDPSTVLTINNWPSSPEVFDINSQTDYILNLNPLYFYNQSAQMEINRTEVASPNGKGFFYINNWPLSANGGLSTVYIQVVLEVANSGVAVYPEGYTVFDQILWQAEQPSTPSMSVVQTKSLGFTGTKTHWKFNASEESSTGFYGTGVARYIGNIIETRKHQLYSSNQTSIVYRTLVPNVVANKLIVDNYSNTNLTTFTTNNSVSLGTTCHLNGPYGYAYYTDPNSYVASFDNTTPDFAAQANISYSITNPNNKFVIQLKITEGANISGSTRNKDTQELTVELNITGGTIVSKLFMLQSNALISGSGMNVQSITLPDYASNLLSQGGNIELYFSRIKIGNTYNTTQMLVESYFTPNNNPTQSLVLGSAIVPSFSGIENLSSQFGTAIVCMAEDLNGNLLTTGDAGTFICKELILASGMWILNADLGECRDDGVVGNSSNIMDIASANTGTQSWSTTTDWEEILDNCSVSGTKTTTAITLAAAVPTGGAANRRSTHEMQCAIPTFSDRAQVKFTFDTTATFTGDAYIAFSSTPVVNSGSTLQQRPMATRCDTTYEPVDEPIYWPTLLVGFSNTEGYIYVVQRLENGDIQRKNIAPFVPNMSTAETFIITIDGRNPNSSAKGTTLSLQRLISGSNYSTATIQVEELLPNAASGLGYYIAIGTRSDSGTGGSTTQVAGALSLKTVVITSLAPIVSYSSFDGVNQRHFIKSSSGAAYAKPLLGQYLISAATDESPIQLPNAIYSSQPTFTTYYAQRIILSNVASPFYTSIKPQLLELKALGLTLGSYPTVRFYADNSGKIDTTTPLTGWINVVHTSTDALASSGSAIPNNKLVQIPLDTQFGSNSITAGTAFWVVVGINGSYSNSTTYTGASLMSSYGINPNSVTEIFTDYGNNVLTGVLGTTPNFTPGTGWLVVTSLWHKLFAFYEQRHDNTLHCAIQQSRVRAESQARLIYDLRSKFSGQASPLSDPVKVDIKPPADFSHGLNGDYYSGNNFQTYYFSQTDSIPTINIPFGSGTPRPGNLPTNQPFTVRWTGFISPSYAELYTFTATNNYAVRLFVDGVKIFDNFGGTLNATQQGTYYFAKSNSKYPITIEYLAQNPLPALLSISWQSVSQSSVIIPTSAFYTLSTKNRPLLTLNAPVVSKTANVSINAIDSDSGMLAFRIGKNTDYGDIAFGAWQPWSLFSTGDQPLVYSTYLYGTTPFLGDNTDNSTSNGIDFNTNLGGNGSKKIWVQTMDSVGNISESFPITVYNQTLALIDTVPPQGGAYFADHSNNQALIYNQNLGQLILNAYDRVSGVKDFRYKLATALDSTFSIWMPFQKFYQFTLDTGYNGNKATDGLARYEVQFRDYGNNAVQPNNLWDNLTPLLDVPNLTPTIGNNAVTFVNPVFHNEISTAMITWQPFNSSNSYLYSAIIKTQTYYNLNIINSTDSSYGAGIAFYVRSNTPSTYGRTLYIQKTDNITVNVTLNGTTTTWNHYNPVSGVCDGSAPANSYRIDTSKGLIVFCTSLPTGSTVSVNLSRQSAQLLRWDGVTWVRAADLGYYNEQCILTILPIIQVDSNSNNVPYLLLGGGSGNIWVYDGETISGPIFSTTDGVSGLPITTLIQHQFDFETQPYIYAGTSLTPRLYRAPLNAVLLSSNWAQVANTGYLASSSSNSGNINGVTCAVSAYNSLFLGTRDGYILKYTRTAIAGSNDNENLTSKTLINTNLGAGESIVLPIACLYADINTTGDTKQILAGIGDRPEIWNYAETSVSQPSVSENWAIQYFDKMFTQDPAPWQFYTSAIFGGASLTRNTSVYGTYIGNASWNDTNTSTQKRQVMFLNGTLNNVTTLTSDSGSDWEQAIGTNPNWMMEFEVSADSSGGIGGIQGIQISDGRYSLTLNINYNGNLTLVSGGSIANSTFTGINLINFNSGNAALTSNLVKFRIGVNNRQVQVWVNNIQVFNLTNFLSAQSSIKQIRIGKTDPTTLPSKFWWGGVKFIVGQVLSPTIQKVQDWYVSWRFPSAGGVRKLLAFDGGLGGNNSIWALTDGYSSTMTFDNPDDRSFKMFSYVSSEEVWQPQTVPTPRITSTVNNTTTINGVIRPMAAAVYQRPQIGNTIFSNTLVVSGQMYQIVL